MGSHLTLILFTEMRFVVLSIARIYRY